MYSNKRENTYFTFKSPNMWIQHKMFIKINNDIIFVNFMI